MSRCLALVAIVPIAVLLAGCAPNTPQAHPVSARNARYDQFLAFCRAKMPGELDARVKALARREGRARL